MKPRGRSTNVKQDDRHHRQQGYKRKQYYVLKQQPLLFLLRSAKEKEKIANDCSLECLKRATSDMKQVPEVSYRLFGAEFFKGYFHLLFTTIVTSLLMCFIYLLYSNTVGCYGINLLIYLLNMCVHPLVDFCSVCPTPFLRFLCARLNFADCS